MTDTPSQLLIPSSASFLGDFLKGVFFDFAFYYYFVTTFLFIYYIFIVGEGYLARIINTTHLVSYTGHLGAIWDQPLYSFIPYNSLKR